MSKINEIDSLNNKAQERGEEVDWIKVSLTSAKSTVEADSLELKNKLERLERYSRDFDIRLVGVEEEEGEDCMAI